MRYIYRSTTLVFISSAMSLSNNTSTGDGYTKPVTTIIKRRLSPTSQDLAANWKHQAFGICLLLLPSKRDINYNIKLKLLITQRYLNICREVRLILTSVLCLTNTLDNHSVFRDTLELQCFPMVPRNL